MSKLSEWSRRLWLEAELAAPPVVQRTLMPRIGEVKEIAQLLIRPYLTIYQMQGQAQGGPLTVTFAGRGHTKASLKSFLFTEEPVEKDVGQVPFWSPDKLADLSGDIIIIEATRYLICKLPRHNAIVLPRIVYHTVDVRGDWQDVRKRFRKSVRKNELRWMRKYGYEYDMSYDRQDFETFYRHMYLPTMDDRHNELSMPMSIGEAYQHFRHGLLFQVMRDGDWVSGAVCHPQQKVLIADILGVKNADARLIHQGATAATYYAVIHWANQHGYEGANFAGSRPYLSSGNFQHKRKWGSTVSAPPDLHMQFWIRVRRSTPAVSQFLMENPCVVIDKDGKLHGLIIVEDPHNVPAEIREGWEKHYATPGLNSLLIRSIDNFAQGSANSNDPDLVIPLSLDSGLEDGQ